MISKSTHLVNTTAAVTFARHRGVFAWCTGIGRSYSSMPNTKRLRLREPSNV